MDKLQHILEHLVQDWTTPILDLAFWPLVGICIFIYFKYCAKAKLSAKVNARRFWYALFCAFFLYAILSVCLHLLLKFLLERFPYPVIPSIFVICACLAYMVFIFISFYRVMLFLPGGKRSTILNLIFFPVFIASVPFACIILCLLWEGNTDNFLIYVSEVSLIEIIVFSMFGAYSWLLYFSFSSVEKALWDKVEDTHAKLAKKDNLLGSDTLYPPPKNNDFIEKHNHNYILEQDYDFIPKQENDYTDKKIKPYMPKERHDDMAEQDNDSTRSGV